MITTDCWSPTAARSPAGSSRPAGRWASRPVAVYSDADADAPHVARGRPGRPAARRRAGRDLPAGGPARRGGRAGPAPTRCIPATASCPRTPTSPRAVLDAGLTWVGPPPKAIAAMGSKVEAKALVAEAGVPVLPTWTGTRCRRSTSYPVLVKASAGGGGRGMRVVARRRDAGRGGRGGAAGGGSRPSATARSSVERYVERRPPRRGADLRRHARRPCVALGERECSIQRRHQKIVEEAPSPAVDAELRAALCRRGGRRGPGGRLRRRRHGRVPARAADGRFYFLEMNTRLQVEHPVTECVTGLDLVALQLPSPRAAAAAHRAAAGRAGTRSRCGSTPRTRRAAGCRAPARCTASPSRRGRDVRPCRSRAPAGRRRRGRLRGQRALRPDAGQGHRLGADPAGGRRGGWPPRWPGPSCTASSPTGTCWSGCCGTPRSLAGDTDTGFLDRHPEVFAPLAGRRRRSSDWPALAAALAGLGPAPGDAARAAQPSRPAGAT